MGFERPTLNEIRTRVQNDIEAELPGSDARLPGRPEYAFAVAVAGASHNAHGRIDFYARQLFPDTAEAEYLDRWSAIWLGGNARKQPTKATGSIRLTGTDTTSVPAGTKIERPSDGTVWVTDSTQEIGETISGEVIVAVTAEEAGSAGNALAYTAVELQNAIAGVDNEGEVGPTGTLTTEGIIGGSDLESDDALRERVLFRIQNGPDIEQPGSFEQRAIAQAGVTRAWEIPNLFGPLTVALYFVEDDDPTGIAPGPTRVSDVETAVQALSSVWATVTCISPTLVGTDFQISLSPDTQEVRDAVRRELEDLFLREGTCKGGTITLQQMREAIGRAPGEDFHTLISPTGDVDTIVGRLAVLGAITWS